MRQKDDRGNVKNSTEPGSGKPHEPAFPGWQGGGASRPAPGRLIGRTCGPPREPGGAPEGGRGRAEGGARRNRAASRGDAKAAPSPRATYSARGFRADALPAARIARDVLGPSVPEGRTRPEGGGGGGGGGLGRTSEERHGACGVGARGTEGARSEPCERRGPEFPRGPRSRTGARTPRVGPRGGRYSGGPGGRAFFPEERGRTGAREHRPLCGRREACGGRRRDEP